MSKSNPEIARLEGTIAMLRRDEAERRKPPGDMPVAGCGDGSCEVSPPTGMHTNGGCRCDERTLRRALRWQRRRSEFLTVTIQDMREAEVRAEVERHATDMAQCA